MANEPGFTVWFTGLSGSGKTTLAEMLRDALRAEGIHAEILDSGRIRREYTRDLGFERADIEIGLRRIGYECVLLNRNGVVAIVSAVSPYRDLREQFRAKIGRFVEVYCRCPIEVLMQRDEQGLYEGARRGEIENLAGINAPYEEPIKPEVLLNTDQESPKACLNKILQTIEVLGYARFRSTAEYSPDEAELIKARLKDFGYRE